VLAFLQVMTGRLLILAFLLSVAADSIAAVAPQMDADGCSARCCQSARQNRRGANPSKLCCLVDCNQSGAANTSSPAVSFVDQRNRKMGADHPCVGTESAAPTRSAIAFRSQTNNTTLSADIYLRTGTLLI